jgi:hypothetical protein
METSILQKIQQDLKAPKSQYNAFGKYKYRNAEDIQEALKPILAMHGHSLTISDDIVLVGDRVYIKALVQLLDALLNPIATTTGYAREPESRKGMDAAQVTGATSSYARKYALGGMFLLDDTKDPDSMAPDVGKKVASTPPPKKPADMKKFLEAVTKLTEEKGMSPEIFDAFMEEAKVKSLEDLKTKDAQISFYNDLKKA